MAYTKRYPGGWKNKPDQSTPFTAAVGDQLEQGIFDAAATADAAASVIAGRLSETELSATFAAVEDGKIREDQLPSFTGAYVATVTQTVEPYATANTNGNGELFVVMAPIAEDGDIRSIKINVRSTTVTTVDLRISAGEMPSYSATSDYTPRAVGEIITLDVSGGAGVYELDPDFPVLAGDLIALHLSSGVVVGYENITSTGPGFAYSYGRATPLAVTPGTPLDVMQTSFAGKSVGFGFSVATPGTALAASNADVTALAGRVGALESASPAPDALAGSKIVALGDSMVYGHNVGVANTWLAKIGARVGAETVNFGINGTYLSNNDYGAHKGAVIRYADMPNDADYVIVFAGTNDANASIALGAADSVIDTEFNGALNVLCSALITKYPTKKIGFITPYRRNANYPAYVDAIKTACAKYGIAVFDNIARGGVDWSNSAQVAALTLGDTYHLNAAGMDYVSAKYEHFIRSL
jgi:lysophospholipase L1-like esterase